MRCFLGLDLSVNSKLALESWREKALPQLDKFVPTANFHITLSFLGNISGSTLDNLCTLMDKMDGEKVTLNLAVMGYWSKPKVLFVAPHPIPSSLAKLANATNAIAKTCNIEIIHKNYQPHVTIARGLKSNPPCELYSPSIECTFDNVRLFESVSGKSGVQYPIRESWPLRPSLPFRD